MPPKSTPGALLGETPAYPPLAPQFWGTLNVFSPQNWGAGGGENRMRARGLVLNARNSEAYYAFTQHSAFD
jgi:hypothetical protein